MYIRDAISQEINAVGGVKDSTGLVLLGCIGKKRYLILLAEVCLHNGFLKHQSVIYYWPKVSNMHAVSQKKVL